MSDEQKHPGETLDQPIPADPIPTPTPGAAVAEKRTAEAWAEAAGLFPEFSLGRHRPGKDGAVVGRPVYNQKFQQFAATKALKGWGDGVELTKDEFDAAVAEAVGHVYR